MTNEIHNQNKTGDWQESNGVKPVKGSLRKILSVGARIAVGGTVIAFVVSLIAPPRVMGVTRSARLKYEQRKTEIEKAMAQQVEQENGNGINEEAKAAD